MRKHTGPKSVRVREKPENTMWDQFKKATYTGMGIPSIKIRDGYVIRKGQRVDKIPLEDFMKNPTDIVQFRNGLRRCLDELDGNDLTFSVTGSGAER